VPESDEVLGDQPHALRVVAGDQVDAGRHRLAGPGDHDRYACRDRAQRGRVGQGADHHEAVDAEVQEGAGRVLAGAAVEAGVGEDGAQTRGVQQGVEPVEQVDVPGVAQIVQQDTDRPGALLAEAARGGIRPVAQLAHGPQHGFPLLGPHLCGAPQHQRDQRLGHPGPFGHVADRRRSHGMDRSMRVHVLSKG
jgi:hypothetical protein